jgi:hypothetical protein
MAKCTFEACLLFIEDKLGVQLMSCQKDMLKKMYDNEFIYYIPGRMTYKRVFLQGLEILKELMKEEG